MNPAHPLFTDQGEEDLLDIDPEDLLDIDPEDLLLDEEPGLETEPISPDEGSDECPTNPVQAIEDDDSLEEDDWLETMATADPDSIAEDPALSPPTAILADRLELERSQTEKDVVSLLDDHFQRLSVSGSLLATAIPETEFPLRDFRPRTSLS